MAQQARSQLETDLAAHRDRLADLTTQVTSVTAEHTRLLAQLGADPPSIDALRRAVTALDEQLEQAETARTNLPTMIRATTRITATTVAGAVAGRPPEQGYDAVVLDEAAMVDLASIFCVTSLARCRVVIAGDFRQLPAIIQTRTGVPQLVSTRSPESGA